eukprot:4530766-Alexandrium_andersonii.AAC.1
MSASLVGSEMCIRDRSRISGCSRAPGPASRRRLRSTRPCYSRLRRSWPVSYTHLTLPTICSV